MSNTAQTIQDELVKNTRAASEISAFLNPYALTSFSNQSTSLTSDNVIGLASNLAVTSSGIDVAGVNNLVDCARNLEDRILSKLQDKLINLLLSNPQAAQVLSIANAATAYISSISQVVDTIKKVKPEDLLTSLIAAKALSGLQRDEKVAGILKTFGNSVNGIVDMIENLDVLDICSIPNVSASGASIPPGSNIPSGPPSEPRQTAPFANVVSPINETAEEYNSLILRVRDSTGKNVDMVLEPGYESMLTSVNTVVLSYHDKVMKSSSITDDPRLYEEYLKSVEIESNTHNSVWSDLIRSDYTKRCQDAGVLIKNNTDVIRNYGLRNSNGPITGTLLSTGITYYSGVIGDLTTFLEVKREERPPEAVAYWSSRVNIADQEQRMVNRGLRVSYIPYSWSVSAAYGKLESDFTCASTRVPGGSVLALKNPDGTPYNPSGRNPNGIVTVTDTGKYDLTYKKVDVYTNTPNVYKNMDSVHVYLVSLGTKTNSQYRLAQSKFGKK